MPEPPADPLTADAIALADAEGAAAAVERLRREADPGAQAKAFAGLARHLYRQRKDVGGMILAAEAGIGAALAAAQASAEPKAALALRTAAKTLAFNAGANCWPGWDDKGVAINRLQALAGLSLAETCLRLVSENGFGPMQEANGHWLVGALRLALGEPAAAEAEFKLAAAAFTEAGDAPAALMAQAYLALAQSSLAALAESLGRLTLDGSKDALFYRDQLVTAQMALAVWTG
jgi:hypothetical protein